MLRKSFKFTMLACGVLAGGLLSSCSNESEPTINPGNMLVKAPKVIAYSGDVILGQGTRGSNLNANMWGDTYDCPLRAANDLTEQELAELKELLSPGHPVENDVVINFEEYWVQQIFKGDATYAPDDVFGNPCTNQDILGSSQMDHFEVMGKYGYERVENFERGNNTNNPGNCSACGQSHFGTTLKVDMPTNNTDPSNQFRFWESYGSDNYFNYIIVEYNGYYYLGFDYQMEKEANNPNEADHVNRDWNFTDWIVRIVPAYHKDQTPAENPGGVQNPGGGSTEQPGQPEQPNQPDQPATCPDCGHEAHDGVVCPNEECTTPDCGHFENHGDDNPGVGEDVTPGHKHADEVEVNLSADEKNGQPESHLSIHVRAATDVEVFIPVPKQYYCEADDMAIVMEHEANHMIHGGPYVLEYQLKDSDLTVKLTVAFEDDGIRITTDGITQEVIDWCAEKCHGDGITFEIWNYFNEELSLDELKEYLNQATIRFLDKEPDSYINAFNKDSNGTKFEDDCTVDIVDEQRGNYQDPNTGNHLNGSPYNEIYEHK